MNQRLLLAATLLLGFSRTALADGSFKREGASPKTYVCSEGGAIWNQSQPCSDDTFERGLMRKRTNYDQLLKQREELATLLNKHRSIDASLTQIKNYPERYLGQEVKLQSVWMSGNIGRSDRDDLPSGKQTLIYLRDKFDRGLAVAGEDRIGLELSDEINPALDYLMDWVTVKVDRNERGFVVFLSDYSFSDKPGKKSGKDLELRSIPSPILDYGKVVENKKEEKFDSEEEAPQQVAAKDSTQTQSSGSSRQVDAPSLPKQAGPNAPISAEQLQALLSQKGAAALPSQAAESRSKFGEIQFNDIKFKSDEPGY